jgi:hexulose-6-phosphate isomerase
VVNKAARNLLPAIADSGFDGIEPTFVDGGLPSPGKDYLGEARELRKLCDDLGLGVPSMRGGRVPWDTIPSPKKADRRRALEHTEKALEALSIMGGETLLVVPGETQPDIAYRDHWARVVEYGVAAGEMAGRLGMTIALENVEARFPLSSSEWASLIDEIDHDRVGMYFDAGNVLWLGLGYPAQWIRVLGNRIRQVHFKDATFFGEIRHLLAGEVDWPAVMGALVDVGYEGWILVEPTPYAHAADRLPARLIGDLDAIIALGNASQGDLS